MKTVSTTAARQHFGKFLKEVQNLPMRVTRRGKVIGFMVCADDYEDARRFYFHRLLKTLAALADKAAKGRGTPEQQFD